MVIDMAAGRSASYDARFAQSELVRRYARGELQDPELTEFECAMFEDSALTEQVEVELAWYRGLTAGTEAALPVAAAAPTRHPSKAWHRWSLAASLLVGVALGSLLSLQTSPSATSVQSARLVALTAIRGSVASNDVTVPAEQTLVLRLLANGPLPHQLTISDAAGRAIADQTGLAPDTQGWLVLITPPLAANGAPYQLRISSEKGTEQFILRVE